MATHTKPASVALQLLGVLTILLGAPFAYAINDSFGITILCIGVLVFISGGKATRQRIREDQS